MLAIPIILDLQHFMNSEYYNGTSIMGDRGELIIRIPSFSLEEDQIVYDYGNNIYSEPEYESNYPSFEVYIEIIKDSYDHYKTANKYFKVWHKDINLLSVLNYGNPPHSGGSGGICLGDAYELIMFQCNKIFNPVGGYLMPIATHLHNILRNGI